MPPVDLKKNKDSIVKAHKEVFDPHSKTNWALFGYEGQTDVLKFISKGDGGIEELLEDLSSGKMLYAYVKVIDPNTNLPKFVFINWQGEGVPEVRKGACANHVRDVQTLLLGAHVSINARREEDVDEKLIISKVSKASGANYSFHKEQKKAMPAVEPVGSVYQKTRPQVEIKPDVKQAFWDASERDEKQRILLEKQRAAQERAKLDKEIKDREEKEMKAREQRESDRVKKIREIRDAEKASATDSSANKNYNPADAARDEEERAKRSDQMRKERAAEAKSLVSGRAGEAKSKFEQKPSSQFDQPAREPAPAKKLKHAFLEGADQPAEPAQRKQPIQLPKADAPTTAKRTTPSSPPAVVPPPRTATPPRAVEPEHDDVEEQEEPEDYYDDAVTIQRAVVTSPTGPKTPNLLAQGMPRRQPDSDEEPEDDQNWEEPTEEYKPQPTKHVAAPEPEEEELYQDTAAASYKHEEEESDELYQDTAAVTDSSHSHSTGVCARALYDYEASEENEITFDPEDTITEIEMIDEGWWIGTAPSGKRGMFPSNYVELF